MLHTRIWTPAGGVYCQKLGGQKYMQQERARCECLVVQDNIYENLRFMTQNVVIRKS